MPEVLTITPLAGYGYSEDTECAVLTDGGAGESVRRQIGPTLRRYSLAVSATNSERLVIDAFFRARTYVKDAFYWSDPADHSRTAVALGTGTGAQTVFSIPSGETLLDYPVTATLKVNGSPVAATVQTDARTITAAVAPGLGTTVTADYDYYRKVRLASPYDWTVEAANFNKNEVSLEFTEVYGE